MKPSPPWLNRLFLLHLDSFSQNYLSFLQLSSRTQLLWKKEPPMGISTKVCVQAFECRYSPTISTRDERRPYKIRTATLVRSSGCYGTCSRLSIGMQPSLGVPGPATSQIEAFPSRKCCEQKHSHFLAACITRLFTCQLPSQKEGFGSYVRPHARSSFHLLHFLSTEEKPLQKIHNHDITGHVDKKEQPTKTHSRQEDSLD